MRHGEMMNCPVLGFELHLSSSEVHMRQFLLEASEGSGQRRFARIVPAVDQIELFELRQTCRPLEVRKNPERFDVLDAANHGQILPKTNLL